MLKSSVLPILFLAFSACTSPQYWLEKGNYDKAITHYLRKMSGDFKKTKHVQGLETAFAAAQKKDKTALDSLLAEQRAENWPSVNALHRKILKREKKVMAALPLTSDGGYEPSLFFIPGIESAEAESRRAAADFLYQKGVTLLESATSEHNRFTARQAHGVFSDLLNNYFSDWKDAAALSERARELGTTYILLKDESWFSFGVGQSFFNEAMPDEHSLNGAWQVFHADERPGVAYDFVAKITFNQVTPGTQNISESCHTETKEIVVKEEVKYDTAGKVIERNVITETAVATICTVTATKIASADWTVEISRYTSGERVSWRCFSENYTDSSCCTRVTGDSRATSASNNCIGFWPSCSGDYWMLSRLAERVRPTVVGSLRSETSGF